MDHLQKNVVKSSLTPVRYNNCTVKLYILLRYKSVAKNLSKAGLFEEGFPGNWQKKYFSILQLIISALVKPK